MLLMSAYGVLSASRYSSTSGSSQKASPWCLAGADHAADELAVGAETPATLGPSARTHGAGEGRDVDDVRGALLARAGEARR